LTKPDMANTTISVNRFSMRPKRRKLISVIKPPLSDYTKFAKKLDKDFGAGKIRSVTYAVEFSDGNTRVSSYGDLDVIKINKALSLINNQALDETLARNYASEDLKFLGLTIMQFAPSLRSLFSAYGIRTCLDYGCGRAGAWKNPAFKESFGLDRLILYDPYVPEYNTLTDSKVDAVIACDVAEHIPPHRLSEFFRRMFLRARKLVVFTFCSRPSSKFFSDGTDPHVSKYPMWWWEQESKKHNIRGIPVVILENQA